MRNIVIFSLPITATFILCTSLFATHASTKSKQLAFHILRTSDVRSNNLLLTQKTSQELEQLADQMEKQYSPGEGAAEIQAVEERLKQLSPKEVAQLRKIIRNRDYDISGTELEADSDLFDNKIFEKIQKKYGAQKTIFQLDENQRDEIYNSLKNDTDFDKLYRKLEKMKDKSKKKKKITRSQFPLVASSLIFSDQRKQSGTLSLNWGTCPTASYGSSVSILRTPKAGIFYGSSFFRDVVNSAGEVPCDYEMGTPELGMLYVTHNSQKGKCILDQFGAIGANSTRNRFIIGGSKISIFCGIWSGSDVSLYINFSKKLY